MGRPPKPRRMKIIQGNSGKRPIGEDPPVELGIPECPAHLTPEAAIEWNRVSQELNEAGLLAKADRGALAAYCQTWARWVDAETQLAKTGTVVKAPSGYPIQSPYLAIANKALELMRSFMVEFGMTPVSRARVGAKPAGGAGGKKKPANPFKALSSA